VFPLLDLIATRSSKVEEVKSQSGLLGKGVSIERVDYEFQKGGNDTPSKRSRVPESSER